MESNETTIIEASSMIIWPKKYILFISLVKKYVKKEESVEKISNS